MADKTDVLLKFCDYNWAQVKQAEDQRVSFSNMILLISSAVIGLIAQKGFSKSMVLLSILLMLLGVFGILVSRKYQERIRYHLFVFNGLRAKIDGLHEDVGLEKLRVETKEIHSSIYPLTSKIRPGYLWVSLHSTIATAGLVITIVIIATHLTN